MPKLEQVGGKNIPLANFQTGRLNLTTVGQRSGALVTFIDLDFSGKAAIIAPDGACL